jgi:hypothetical protein
VFVLGAVTIRFGVELRMENIREEQLAMLASVARSLLDQETSGL